jgi:hypothetical protein
MRKPKAITVRNTAGGDSPYTIEKSTEESYYTVTDTKRGRSWTVQGHNESCNRYPGPPAYVTDAVHREWAKDQLRDSLKPGDTVYTILHHVSSSGMSRRIGVRAIVNGQPQYLDGLVAVALGERVADRGGIIMGGCGMDMGFELSYRLGHALYPDGVRCLGKKKCRSNDHSNDYAFFSHEYDERFAPEGSPWWLADDRMIGSEDYPLTDEDRARRDAYRLHKREAWEAGEAARYSRRRVHNDGGYAFRHDWL